MDKRGWRLFSAILFVLLLFLFITLQVQANLTSVGSTLASNSSVAEFSPEQSVVAARSSQGSGGATVLVNSVNLVEQKVKYGDVKPSRLQFDFEGRPYAIQLWRIKQDHAEFVILSLDADNLDVITAHTTKDSFILDIGDKKEVDIDGDGVYDIVIELDRVDSPFSLSGERTREGIRSVDFSIERINYR